MIGRSFASGQYIQLRAVHDENVRPAVVVIVKNRNAGSSSLNNVFFGGNAPKRIGHGQASSFRDVREVGKRFSGGILRIIKRQNKREGKQHPESNARTETNPTPRTRTKPIHHVN